MISITLRKSISFWPFSLADFLASSHISVRVVLIELGTMHVESSDLLTYLIDLCKTPWSKSIFTWIVGVMN